MKTLGIILIAAYIAALPFAIIFAKGVKDEFGWEKMDLAKFLSVWLVVPIFFIKNLINHE